MQIRVFFITQDQRAKNVLLCDTMTKHKEHPKIPPNLIKHIVCILRPLWFDIKRKPSDQHAPHLHHRSADNKQKPNRRVRHETQCRSRRSLSNCRYLSSVSSRIIFPWRRASNQLRDSGEPSLLKDVCLFLCHHLYVCGRHRQCNRIPRFRFAESVYVYLGIYKCCADRVWIASDANCWKMIRFVRRFRDGVRSFFYIQLNKNIHV